MDKKVYNAVMSGKSDSNIRFSDLRNLLESVGFRCRVKGDHFIYTADGIQEIINIQPKGNKSKPYQVKQIRELFNKYGI